MGIVFRPAEVLEIACQVERDGVMFYRKAAELTSDSNARALFLPTERWLRLHR